MPVEREEPESVVEDHHVAVDAEWPDEGHAAAVGRFDRVVLRDRKVVAQVKRGVDRLAVVRVRARVREVRLDLRVAELAERALPANRGRGLAGDLGDLVLVLLAQLPVDRDEDILGRALPRRHVGQERRHLVLQEIVGEGDGALLVLHVLQLVGEPHLARIAGLVGGRHRGPRVRGNIVGMREQREEVVGVILDEPREAGEEVVTDLDAALRRIGRGLVDDRAHAAEVHVAVVCDELERGRGDVDREVLLDRRLVAAEPVPERRVARGDANYRRTFLQAGEFRQGYRDLLLPDRLAVLLGQQRLRRAALGKGGGDRFQSGARVGHGDIERRGADRIRVRGEGDLWGIGLETLAEEDSGGYGCDDEGEENDNKCFSQFTFLWDGFAYFTSSCLIVRPGKVSTCPSD